MLNGIITDEERTYAIEKWGENFESVQDFWRWWDVELPKIKPRAQPKLNAPEPQTAALMRMKYKGW